MDHLEGDGVHTSGSCWELCRQMRKRQSKQNLERRKSSTWGKVCDRVASCLLSKKIK